jgi:hypothetical protein
MFPNCSVATRWAQIVNEWVALELDGAPRPRFMARAGGAGST